MGAALVVMGKLPRAGQVKTRLAAAVGPETAARLYAAFLEDVLTMAARWAQTRPGRAWFAVAGTEPASDEADGRRWAPSPIQVFAQAGDDLGGRIEHARARVASERVVVIGSDAPLFSEERVDAAVRALEDHDAVIGPTADGGYDAIGFRGARPELLRGIPWSTPDVAAATERAANRFGLRLAQLPVGYDVDDLEDLRRLADDPHLSRAPATARAVAAWRDRTRGE
ncbi:MAG TPA: TIGR04282 family arsenosugar biosynthesis glycosyltransferase [Myxococcales bacterium LLY-WYZ-16_1]|nr:TIGR04282 family arsenosugar biosynthesis glycosyltransferase [Myxococcales bacterium LLY-WYZ-16_1]